MSLKTIFSFGSDLWDPSNRFETSWFLSPWALFACRALIALYVFVSRFFIIGWNGGDSLSYFTVLGAWGLAFYFLVAATHTFTYALRGRALLERFPRPLQALHSFFYTTIITLPLIVTITYWAVLYEGPWYEVEFDAWSNVSQHSINSVLAVFEIVVPRTSPPPWIHILWLIVIMACYLGVAYITAAVQGWYPYNFLDYKSIGGRGYVAAYIVGIAVGVVIIFLVAWGLIWVRRWITESKMGMEGKFAKQQSASGDVEMNTIGAKHRNNRQSDGQDETPAYQPDS